jgi:hypothetical protein
VECLADRATERTNPVGPKLSPKDVWKDQESCCRSVNAI